METIFSILFYYVWPEFILYIEFKLIENLLILKGERAKPSVLCAKALDFTSCQVEAIGLHFLQLCDRNTTMNTSYCLH